MQPPQQIQQPQYQQQPQYPRESQVEKGQMSRPQPITNDRFGPSQDRRSTLPDE